MEPGVGSMMVGAIVYFVIVLAIVALVISALWRMARAQESIAAALAEIRESLRTRGTG
jgi:hypothetical protein